MKKRTILVLSIVVIVLILGVLTLFYLWNIDRSNFSGSNSLAAA